MTAMESARYPELRELTPGEPRFMLVAFWGVETSRVFFATRAEALEAGNAEAALGADVHVCRVLAQSVIEVEE